MKILIMGDIHSNYVAFKKCIEEEINNVDKIIMMGDYVSDCPYPQRTMEQVLYLKKYFQTWLIKGNREDYQIMHSKGKLDFWTQNSSTGSLLYTYQNLSKEDIKLFEKLNDSEIIDLGSGKQIFVCHGTPESNRIGIFPDTSDIKSYISDCCMQIMICAHTHQQFVYSYKDKVLLNPGSIGLPLGSKGKLQYAILEWTKEGMNIQMKNKAYDVQKIICDFESSGLDKMAPIYSKTIKDELVSGYPYMPCTLEKAKELMKQHEHTGEAQNIPERYWEEAYRVVTFDKERDNLVR